jgi:putative redox protein
MPAVLFNHIFKRSKQMNTVRKERSSAIKNVIEATADAVTLNPAAAVARFAADSDLVGACEVDVRIGDKTVKVDEPESLGGSGCAPNPVEYALGSLGSCQAITYRFWSEKLGIRIDKLRVEVQGDLDVRGVFGIQNGVRPGFGKVDVKVHLSGPETPERYEELRRAVNEHCPVLDIFANPVPVRTHLAAG